MLLDDPARATGVTAIRGRQARRLRHQRRTTRLERRDLQGPRWWPNPWVADVSARGFPGNARLDSDALLDAAAASLRANADRLVRRGLLAAVEAIP